MEEGGRDPGNRTMSLNFSSVPFLHVLSYLYPNSPTPPLSLACNP